ncbi:MAG TPA: FkbM family methyltransferase [Acidimicrobiia bacterium]|nr:FkbM family methyltransferase [Acidimicrobiia bacterium]
MRNVPAWMSRLRRGVVRRATGDAKRARDITAEAFFGLAFGRSPDAAEIAQLHALVPERRIQTPAQAHRVLLAFDAQSHPTAFLVRATVENLRRVELDRFVLWLDTDDPAVSAVIRHERGWEAHVSDVLTERLRPGSTFVDVGANVGYHTFLAASIVGPDGSVIAIEASSENCRLLQLSKTENHAENVLVLPFALDREPGVRYLSSHVGTNAGLIPDQREHLLDGRGTPVFATTLDEIAPSKIDVMKIDVEGAEFRVLEGGRKSLERDKPLILMEFSCEMAQRTSGVDPGTALQDILDLGYRLFVLDRRSRQPVAFASAAALLADWDDPLHIEDLLLEPS